MNPVVAGLSTHPVLPLDECYRHLVDLLVGHLCDIERPKPSHPRSPELLLASGTDHYRRVDRYTHRDCPKAPGSGYGCEYKRI